MTGSEDRPQLSDETIAFSNEGIGTPPPPPETTMMYGSGSDGGPPAPWRNRQLLVVILVFLIGLAAGFAAAQIVRHSDARIPSDDQVLWESASTTFPVAGAEFTKSAFDPKKQKCDKDVLLKDLRGDDKRFGVWLGLQDIKEAEFKPFVERLQTKILKKATPATDYGCFPGGPCPFSIQAVLAPGTPAWFDPAQDRIVAKCTSSSPLRTPKCPPNCDEVPSPTPSPTPSPSPTPTPTRSASSHRTSSPHRTSRPHTPSPTDAPLPTPSPIFTPPPTPSPLFTPEETLTPPPGF